MLSVTTATNAPITIVTVWKAIGPKDFDDTDHTEEEEYHPNDLVTFEDVAYLFIHIRGFLLIL